MAGKHPSGGENRYPAEQLAWMTAIKAALNEEIVRQNLSVNRLHQLLEERYALHLNLGTLANTINPVYAPGKGGAPNLTMNFFCVMALCDYLGIDLRQFPLPTSATGEGAEASSSPSPSPTLGAAAQTTVPAAAMPALVPLTDEKYLNTYRLFSYVTSRSGEGQLFRYGKLVLARAPGADAATATLTLNNEGFSDAVPNCCVYRGTPYFNQKDESVFLCLADQYGSSTYLHFKYSTYKTQQMRLRCALMVRCRPSDDVNPRAQKVLITLEEGAAQPGKEDWPLIRGLLRMSEDKIFVSRPALAQFLEDYREEIWMPVFRDFVSQRIGTVSLPPEEERIKLCYTFSQSELMALGGGSSNQELPVSERLRMVYTLLSCSEVPEQINCRTPERVHRLFV